MENNQSVTLTSVPNAPKTPKRPRAPHPVLSVTGQYIPIIDQGKRGPKPRKVETPAPKRRLTIAEKRAIRERLESVASKMYGITLNPADAPQKDYYEMMEGINKLGALAQHAGYSYADFAVMIIEAVAVRRGDL